VRKVIIGILIAAAAISAVVFGLSRAQKAAASKVEVSRTVTVKRDNLRVTVSENGTLEPVTQVEVKSRVAGRILRIFVQEGQRVTVGDPIALIDPTEVTRDVARIEAQMAAARAGLAQAEENYRVAKTQNELAVRRAEASLNEAKRRLTQASAPNREQEIQQAAAAVTRAEAAAQRVESSLTRIDAQILDAKRTLERQENLVKKGFVAQSTLDTAKTTLAVAEADRAATLNDRASAAAEVASAKQRLSLLKAGPRAEDIAPARAAVETAKVALEAEKANAAQAEVRKRDVERARAEIAQIQNQLATQRVQLQETRIVAPRSGEITGKYLNEGELVASATAGFAQGAVLVRIADLSKMQVKVNVNEVDVVRVRVDQPVEIRVDGIPDQVFRGRVASIAPSSLNANQASSQSSGQSGGVVRFEVKVAVTTPDARLRPGMTAAVQIVLDEKKSVLTLPAEALQPNNQVTVVTGTGEQRTKAPRPVTVGLRNTATVEIASGLKEGEIVEVPKVDAKDRRKININGPD
jgi:HlyD family secretion protein